MTGRVEGKVAFITGAGRGQGRSHAIRLAQEGANIIAVDICADIDTVPYGLATDEDLAQTVKEVEATGQRIVASHADVRDYEALKRVLDDGVETFGRLDIVSANAGIDTNGVAHELSDTAWDDVVDTNLKGVWHTTKAATSHFIESGAGGAQTLTSSSGGV
jgi:(+)-trans-carveol dehydrogenase